MLLEARGITKAFGSFKAVDDASVTLEQGDILGLIGPNGAGKSTFFNCLTGDLKATSGRVLFEGSDITDFTPEQRAGLGLARTFQVPQTFEGMTVLENVMIGAFLRASPAWNRISASCAAPVPPSAARVKVDDSQIDTGLIPPAKYEPTGQEMRT